MGNSLARAETGGGDRTTRQGGSGSGSSISASQRGLNDINGIQLGGINSSPRAEAFEDSVLVNVVEQGARNTTADASGFTPIDLFGDINAGAGATFRSNLQQDRLRDLAISQNLRGDELNSLRAGLVFDNPLGRAGAGINDPVITRQDGLLDGLVDVTGTVGTGVTSGFLLSNTLQGGIELSSQRLLFNTVDSISGFADDAGRLLETVKVGQLGAQPLLGAFNNPTFSFLEAGESAARGGLGISFNGGGNSLSIAKGLDFIGQKLFFAQTGLQLFDLGGSIFDDFNTTGATSLTSETKAQLGQTALDIGFGAIGTFGGPVGAVIGLSYTFRGGIGEASRVSAEMQQQKLEFQLENNIFPLPTGPKF